MSFREEGPELVPEMSQDIVPADAVDPTASVERVSKDAAGQKVTLQYSGLRVLALAQVLAIKDRAGGHDIISDVLADARDEESPLHPYFEWDDGVAAEQYRWQQAYGLVRRVKVTITPVSGNAESITVPALVAERSLKDVEGVSYSKGSYVPAEKVAGWSAAREALDEKVSRTIGRLRELVSDREKALKLVADAYDESDDE